MTLTFDRVTFKGYHGLGGLKLQAFAIGTFYSYYCYIIVIIIIIPLQELLADVRMAG